MLTFYSSRLFDVHVGQFDTYNSERFVNQSTQSQSWRESRNPMYNRDTCRKKPRPNYNQKDRFRL